MSDKTPPGEGKVFNDPIHGPIELHPLMVKIIDTPQFQRLRYIKQMGGMYHVFPGASHNRFEHSIGVGYLAGRLVETLQKKQPKLDIDEKDVLCVKIAGLCHDLGHGPFSHLFETVIKRVQKKEWKHEGASVMMLNHLIMENGLDEEMKKYKLDKRDRTFIEELIEGKMKCKGRDEDKWFLTEIVANKRTGIDVDKWDYLARDCHGLGLTNNFDMRRYMAFVRVIPETPGSKKQICVRDKEVDNLYEMFHARHTLHRRACKHKTVVAIEEMLIEALVSANDHLCIPGTSVKMSEAITEPKAYTRLTDNIVSQILSNTKPELSVARDLLARIEKRQLYKLVGKAKWINSFPETGEILEEISKQDADSPKPTKKYLHAVVVTFHYGMEDINPLEQARFYKKNDPDTSIPLPTEEVSEMRPVVFLEKELRIYYTKAQPDKDELEGAERWFDAWYSKKKQVKKSSSCHF